MHVRRISTSSELAKLESEWNALAGDIPLRSWDWLATWWKHYGECAENTGERELFVLAVFDDPDDTASSSQSLIGIVPWYLDRTRLQGNVVRWLGSGEVCTDHLSLLCKPENVERVAGAIADVLTEQFDEWDIVDLSAVDASDGPIEKLRQALEERDCVVACHSTDSYWVLSLPSSWDEYLAGVSKPHRRKLRQLDRDVVSSGRVIRHRVKDGAEFEHAWGVLVDLHQRRWRSQGEPGCFASPTFHDFHREVAGRMLKRGQLRLSWMELDGVPAAAEYQVTNAATTYAYQGGIDPDRLADEPGTLSMIMLVRESIELGYEQIDFLRGNEHYKSRWRATPHEVYNCRVIPNRRLARLRSRVWDVTYALGHMALVGAEMVLS